MYACVRISKVDSSSFFLSLQLEWKRCSNGVVRLQPSYFLNLFYFTRPMRRGNQIKFISNFVWPCVMSSRFHTQKTEFDRNYPTLRHSTSLPLFIFPSGVRKTRKSRRVVESHLSTTNLNSKKPLQIRRDYSKFQKTNFNFSNFRPVIFTRFLFSFCIDGLTDWQYHPPEKVKKNRVGPVYPFIEFYFVSDATLFSFIFYLVVHFHSLKS